MKDFKRSLVLKLKLVQVKINTWRRQNEINKAYSSGEGGSGYLTGILRILIKNIPLFTVGAIIITALIFIPYKEIYDAASGYTQGVIKGLRSLKRENTEGVQEERSNTKESENERMVFMCEADTMELEMDSIDFLLPHRGFRYMILVNKSMDSLYLIEYNEKRGPRVAQSYSIAKGKNQGRKNRSGDLKTPEGLYNIIGRREDEELPPKYGPYSFILNYPNHTDVMEGRTGYGIWIHGTNPDSVPIDTKGCIEMKNRDIRELAERICLGIGIPVLIASLPDLSEPENYPDYNLATRKRCEVMRRYSTFISDALSFLKHWAEAWESRNIGRYAACYDTSNFSGYGLDWEEWRIRKERTFRNYEWIEIDIDKIVLTEMNKRFISLKFIQGYTSNLFDSKNGKMIRLSFDGREFKVIKEESISEKEIQRCYSQRKRKK